MAITFLQASERYSKKFPNKKLLTFFGTNKPCTILCGIHGEQLASEFKKVLSSKTGCPVCGASSSINQSTQRFKARDTANSKIEQIKALLTADGLSSDDFRLKVAELLK